MDPKKLQIKAFAEKVEGKLLAVASEEITDRDGDVISIDGWDLKNFKKNPVLMWLHMMDGSTLPIGKANGIGIRESGGKRKLMFEPEFHEITDEARTIKQMFDEGYLRAFSVGFQPKEWEKISQDGEFPPKYKYTKQELIEISAVPIPSLPTAVIVSESEKKGFNMNVVKSLIKDMDSVNKGVIPYKETPKSPEDESWDAGAEMMACGDDMGAIKTICTWFDSEKSDIKSSYKLPHHKGAGDHSLVWNGVKAAMGALLGARGGVNIPDEDKKGVYNHLAKHYKEFDKEAPEFKAYSAEEVFKMDQEGIIDLGSSIDKEMVKSIVEKQGRVLSKRNEDKIRGAVSALQEVLSALGQESEKEEEGDGKAVTVDNRLEKIENQIKHLIGEIQSYRKESGKKVLSDSNFTDEDLKDALRIVAQAASIALKKAKELKNSSEKGGEK